MGEREQLSGLKTRHQSLRGDHEAGTMQDPVDEANMTEESPGEEESSLDGFSVMAACSC